MNFLIAALAPCFFKNCLIPHPHPNLKMHLCFIDNIPGRTLVWVANWLSPIPNSSGVLMVNSSSSLVLLSQNTTIALSANIIKETRNLIVQLLDSGNLVLKEENEDNYLCQ